VVRRPPLNHHQNRCDLALLGSFVVLAAVWYELLLRWHRVRTAWLARLAARGELAGRYTPYAGSAWGSLRWVVEQRIPTSDLPRMRELERVPDEDRATESLRLEMRRWKKRLWLTAPPVLVVPFAVARRSTRSCELSG
jgi:hypothetical protein